MRCCAFYTPVFSSTCVSTVNTIIKKKFPESLEFWTKIRLRALWKSTSQLFRHAHDYHFSPVATLAYDTVSDCSCYCLVHWLIEDKWRVDASVNLPSLVRLMTWRLLNQWWSIVNFTHGNKLQRNLNRNFHSRKCIWNCRVVNGDRFFLGLNV